MKNIFIRSIVVMSLFVVAYNAQGETITDPYEILNRHYEALGGLDKIKSQKTLYLEGDLELVGTGLEGSFIQWTQSPIKSRQEVDLKVIKQVSGDNGEFAWMVDQNGKLQIRNDERTLNQRKLQILQEKFEHLNPESDVFELSYEGIDTVSGKDCYVVKIANSINEDVSRQYYDTTSFMMLKSISISPEGECTSSNNSDTSVQKVKT